MTPIVLHHGLMGLANIRIGPVRINYFRGIDRSIAARGYPLIVGRVHPTAGIRTRATQLKQTIIDQLARRHESDAQIVIFAHSMGGLDARYMITHMGMADRVKALVTVSTPHRGSPFADWCVNNLGRRMGGFSLMNRLNVDVQGVVDLTHDHCRAFNEEVPDMPRVKYYSITASRPWNKIPPFALHAYKVVYEAEGENDSLVSVKSAKWGEHLGTWHADHWLTINHRYVPELTTSTPDITSLWLSIVDRLVSDELLEPAEIEQGAFNYFANQERL